jgi:uncharacterized protein (DUF1697 family)
MPTWIGLLRGVNVGGNRLPMAELRDELVDVGLEKVRTYIQSGNVVFDASPEMACDLAATLPPRIEARFGFRPRLLVLSADDLRRAIGANPYPEAEAEPKSVHLYFLAERPEAVDTKVLDALRSETERWHLAGRVFYLHAPDGYGTSKLAAQVEKLLGVDATARNWRTVRKLWGIAED